MHRGWITRSFPRRAKLLVLLLSCVAPALVPDAASAAEPPKRLLLIGQGPDGHPAGTHEFMRGVERLGQWLAPVAGLEVEIVKADEPWTEGPDRLAKVDGAVLFLTQGARWTQTDPRRREALTQLAARGGGLVALHWAIGSKDPEPIEPFLRLLGGCHGGPDRSYQVLETELSPADPDGPITAGIKPFRIRDEFYYRLKFVQPAGQVRPVLQALIDGHQETVAWSWERPDGGRSFGFSGLHFDENWDRGEYRQLLTQATLWTLKMPR